MRDAIEDYLDRLAEQAHPAGPRLRRLLSESETHLRESAAALVAGGVGEEQAAALAVARFGPPEAVARGMRPTLGEVVGDAVRAAWLLAGVGLVAIGGSGALAAAMRLVAGDGFVAGDTAGVTYTPARCADFLEYFPHAGSCSAAAAMHHADEVVSYRIAAGLLGAVVLAAYGWYRRRRRGTAVLPAAVVPITAAVVFTAAAALLLAQATGLAMGAAAQGEPVAGVGDALSAGIVAVLAGALACRTAVRRLMEPMPAGRTTRPQE